MLVGILCRICRCLAGGPRERKPSTKSDGAAVEEAPAAADGPAPGDGLEGVFNDLTAIRGIGITMQDRLTQAGIMTYAHLAEATPEHVREALGPLSRSAKVEAWISQARELAATK